MSKLALLVGFVLSVRNVEAQSLASNSTILQNLTTAVIENVGNQSTPLVNDVFSSVFGGTIANDVPFPTVDIANILSQFGDDECAQQLSMYIASLEKMDDWALRMFDATAKIQPGILEGNTMQIGHYDECLKINAYVNESQITGQYCTAYLTEGVDNRPLNEAVLSVKQSFGLCVPLICNTTTLEKVALLIEKDLNTTYHSNFRDELCMFSAKTKPFSTMSIVSIIFFTSIVVVVVISTLYDIYIYQRKKRQGPNLLIAFSFYTNGKKLFSTKKSPDSIGCLNGLRVISMIWILGAHRYMYLINMPCVNLLDLFVVYTKLGTTFISAANMAVDNFFVASGLLVVYLYLLNKEKGRTISLVMFYVHRILRLTPALAAMVLFQSTLMDRFGSGPFWDLFFSKYKTDCEKNWWWTLLYVQNYFRPHDKCVIQSWYLAVDTQLYFLSPLLLIPLIKWPNRTLSSVVCLTAISCAAAFGISWQKQLGPAFIDLTADVFQYLYAVTHFRAPAWLVGFVLGYMLFQLKNTVIKINKIALVLLWAGSLAVMIGIITYHKRIASPQNMTRMELDLANSLIRLVWAITLSVVIFLCTIGCGGVINRFLSSSIFTVLIRINYSVYLVHLLVIMSQLARMKTPGYFSFLDNFYYFWGDWAISSFLGIVWTLTFESPIITLEKILFGKRKKRDIEPEGHSNSINVLVVNNKLEDTKY